MGYSVARDADEVMREWQKFCVAQTGMSNVYKSGGATYCLEIGREQRDGSMTGTTLKFIGELGSEGGTATPCGSWKIGADGTVVRYPTGLKKLLAK